MEVGPLTFFRADRVCNSMEFGVQLAALRGWEAVLMPLERQVGWLSRVHGVCSGSSYHRKCCKRRCAVHARRLRNANWRRCVHFVSVVKNVFEWCLDGRYGGACGCWRVYNDAAWTKYTKSRRSCVACEAGTGTHGESIVLG